MSIKSLTLIQLLYNIPGQLCFCGLYLKPAYVIFNTDQIACFMYTLSRIAWSITFIILCDYSVCVFWVDNHLCGWNSCDVMFGVELILL